MLEQVFQGAGQFDVIHFHIDYLHFPLWRRHWTPQVTTLHGRLDLPEIIPLYREFRDMAVVSISNAQRRPLPWVNWQDTVYHGLPETLYTFRAQPGAYLAFMGRISPEKGVDRAIELAKRLDMPIKIAAKVDASDQEYFTQVVQPLLRHPLVEYVGEIGEGDKDVFLGHAAALLFLIDWPEPFGLAMIEAMACGTPVIAYRRGSVPEVIDDGVTGFIVDSLEGAVKAVGEVASLSRRRCREVFEERFSATRMAHDYVRTYRQLVEAAPLPERQPPASLRAAKAQLINVDRPVRHASRVEG
jgi:glycosyltransferase involved in cell wall biosynthesis